jgi:hypothetical protein
MREADRLWDDLDQVFDQWGITEIPFTESAPTSLRQAAQLREVFTGRRHELETAIMAFRSRERRRVLVYGWYGIGKTAFILELLDILKRKAKDTLVTYVSLPREAQDLATFALVALAREMEDDEWAPACASADGLATPAQTGGKAHRGGCQVYQDQRGDSADQPTSISHPQL